jgi:hypothetical protein
LNHRAPVVLLFDIPADVIADGLMHFFANNANAISVDGKFEGLGIGNIVHSGIAFTVQVSASPSDFVSENRVFCDIDLASMQSVLAIELGENVKGGEVIAPIIKTLLSLSRSIGTELSAAAVYWRPADILSGFGYFADAVKAYADGGVFPVLALIHFDRNTAGMVSSKGLAFLCEQEMRFSLGMMPLEEGMARVIRVAHDLATNGSVSAPLELLGLAEGEHLVLTPDSAGRIVSVQITSKMDQ